MSTFPGEPHCTYALALWVFSRVLTLLIGPRIAIPVLTAYMGFSMLLTPAMLWWAAYLDSVAPILATLAVIYFFLSYEATRSRRHLAGIALTMALGLSFFETVLLCPAFLVLLSIVYLDRSLSLRKRPRALVRRWPAWVAIAIPSAMFITFYDHRHYSTGSPPTTLSTAIGSYLVAWFKGIGPTFVGISTCYQIVLSHPVLMIGAGQLVFVAAVAWSGLRDGRRTARALVLFALSFALYFGLEAFVRSGSFGTSVGTNFLYLASFAWLLPLCAALAWYPARSATPPPFDGPLRVTQPRNGSSPTRPAVAVAVGVVVFALAIHGQYAQAVNLGSDERDMRAYVSNFSASLHAMESKTTSSFVFDATLPEWLMPLPFYPTNLLSQSVGTQVNGVPWSDDIAPGAKGYAAEADGSLVPATFVPATGFVASGLIRASGAFCLPARFGPFSTTIRLAKELPAADWYLELTARSGSLGTTGFRVTPAGSGPTANVVPFAVRAHRLAIMPTYPDVTVTSIKVTFPGGGPFCGTLAIGQPVSH